MLSRAKNYNDLGEKKEKSFICTFVACLMSAPIISGWPLFWKTWKSQGIEKW